MVWLDRLYLPLPFFLIFLSHTNAHVLALTGNHISCNRVDVTEQQPLKLVDLNFQAPSVLSNDRGTVTLQK